MEIKTVIVNADDGVAGQEECFRNEHNDLLFVH